MSTEITAPAEPIEAPVDAEGAKPDEPLGEPGLAALKSEREARSAAEKQAKEALAKVKDFEDAQKTESEKQTERITEIERENAELKSAKTRAEVAATKQIPSELFAGPASDSPEDLAAFADVLIAYKGETQPQKLIVPNEGRTPENLTPAPQPGVPRLAAAFDEALAKQN